MYNLLNKVQIFITHLASIFSTKELFSRVTRQIRLIFYSNHIIIQKQKVIGQIKVTFVLMDNCYRHIPKCINTQSLIIQSLQFIYMIPRILIFNMWQMTSKKCAIDHNSYVVYIITILHTNSFSFVVIFYQPQVYLKRCGFLSRTSLVRSPYKELTRIKVVAILQT